MCPTGENRRLTVAQIKAPRYFRFRLRPVIFDLSPARAHLRTSSPLSDPNYQNEAREHEIANFTEEAFEVVCTRCPSARMRPGRDETQLTRCRETPH